MYERDFFARMLVRFLRNRKLLFCIFSLSCFVAVGVCCIVNMAIDRQITWAAFPLLSIPFGWAVVSPLFLRKYGTLVSLGVLTVLTLPFLYWISLLTPTMDPFLVLVSGSSQKTMYWFHPIGLPCAVTGLAALWILYPVWRFARIKVWYKAAITVFLLGAVVGALCNYFVDLYLGNDPFIWHRFVSPLVCIVVAAMLGIEGLVRSKAAKRA